MVSSLVITLDGKLKDEFDAFKNNLCTALYRFWIQWHTIVIKKEAE